MDGSAPKQRWRLSLRDVLVLIAVICLLLSLAIPAIQMAREEARKTLCMHFLLQIGSGLNNYHDLHGQFPAAYVPDAQGQPRSSWRIAALPFFTNSHFYDDYALDEPWNSPGNLALAERNKGYGGHFYCCPVDGPQDGPANYLAVTGAATAWPAPASTSLQAFFKPSHSILVAESANTGIHWMEPRDLLFDRLDFTVHAASRMVSSPAPGAAQAISSRHPHGANVLFADGSVEFLAADTTPQVVKAMLTINGIGSRIPRGPRDRVRFDPNSTDDRSPKRISYKLQ